MTHNPAPFAEGIERLAHPILPLFRLVQLLYITTPIEHIAEVLTELPSPVDTGAVTYDNPENVLRPHIKHLKAFEAVKRPISQDWAVFEEDGTVVDTIEALDLWVSQQILTEELEIINSLLCGPCGCTLCCIGPDDAMAQDFFEIPLQNGEESLFQVPHFETKNTLDTTAYTEPSLTIDSRPFFKHPPTIYHWQNGWGLILGRETACPNLNKDTGACTIYTNRPWVCRRPQVFPYVIERAPQYDKTKGGEVIKAYVRRGKLLAVWECPYVSQLKDNIATYAELCGLEPVFKKNKA